MAKFKKGDRVVATKPDYQTKGVGVVRGYEYSWDEEIERDDPGWYIVDFPNQYKVKMGKGSLRLANSRVCNAKFKVGDKVKINPSSLLMKLYGNARLEWRGEVVGFDGPNNPIVEWETGDLKKGPISDIHLVFTNAARSRNAVVQKALNAARARNGYAVLRTASGGTARVYEGEEVEYDGKSYKAAALGSPSMAEATLVDGAGNKIVVRMRDPRLKAKALNASRARNAKYKLSSKEAKAGDLVRVAGALGTYVVTKVDGDWIEITDAEDGTPHGRVEARYATPVRG